LDDKEMYQNTECSLKRNCMKLMQVFNVILKNPLDVLHRWQGSQKHKHKQTHNSWIKSYKRTSVSWHV